VRRRYQNHKSPHGGEEHALKHAPSAADLLMSDLFFAGVADTLGGWSGLPPQCGQSYVAWINFVLAFAAGDIVKAIKGGCSAVRID